MFKISKINKRKLIIVLSITTIILGLLGYGGYKLYTAYKIEMQRIAHINKDDIDVRAYVDIADEIGHAKDYQLNWREIVAVAGIITNDYLKTINNDDIIKIATLFINEKENRVNSFEEVINLLVSKEVIKEKDIERANVYLEDVATYGYMPERYVADSREMKFINSIKEGAINSYKEYNILPSITIAQAIVESGWGETKLSTDANNLFGIKADIFWKGEKVKYETLEFNDTYIMDYFRKYNDKNESLKDHSDFLVKNERYKNAGVFDAKNYKEQALRLQEAGYSTAQDENGNKIYADKLITIIKQYNLQLIDHEVLNSK